VTSPAPSGTEPSGTAAGAGAPAHTGSQGTRVLGSVTAAGLVMLSLFALVFSPAEADQGDAVRLMYIHVPTAVVAFLAFFVTAAGSALWLWKKSRWWDLVAASSAEIGVIFTALTLVTGMVWGRPIWGVYWTWDARLTSTALLLLLFLGYLAIRRVPAEPDVRNRRAAFAGLIAVVDVPIVHYSVNWWNSLHQEPTITRLDPSIDGLMLFTLMLGIVVFLLLYLWLLVHRFRLAWLEEQLASSDLAAALVERRAEADEATISAPPAPSSAAKASGTIAEASR